MIGVIVGTWIPLYLIYQEAQQLFDASEDSLCPGHGFAAWLPSTASIDDYLQMEEPSRRPVVGTVARGHLYEDDHFYRGYRDGSERKSNDPWLSFLRIVAGEASQSSMTR